MRTIIRFTLKLQHRNGGNCLKDNGEMESCSVKGQTETGHLVILWDNNNNNGTTCSRETQDEASFIEDKGQSRPVEVLGHDYSYGGEMVPVWNREKGISWKLVETSKPKGCDVCGVERDDGGYHHRIDYIVGAKSQDVGKANKYPWMASLRYVRNKGE